MKVLEKTQSLRLFILLVEDDPLIAMTMVDMLETFGHSVTEVSQGKDALSLLEDETHRTDLMITDLGLPDMDGAALVKESRRLKPNLPVILATGSIPDPDLLLNEEGPTILVSKPFQMEMLKAAISQAFQSSPQV